MEPVGLAVGVAGLAGLFSTCLEAVQRVDSYKNYGRDSRSLAAQFDADKHRLEQWGQAVGIEKTKLSDAHHPALDNQKTFSLVQRLLVSIQDFCSGADDAIEPQPLLADGEFPTNKLLSTQLARSRHGAPTDSKWRKVAWALRGKTKSTDQIQTFALLVQCLYNVVPPDDAKGIRLGYDGSSAETKRGLRAWLGCPSPNDLYDDAVQKRLGETCEWILTRDIIRNWLSPNVSASASQMLWINGPAGFGKTVLCAKLAEVLSSSLQTPVAHFFLSSKFEGREDPFMAIRSWIAQVMSLSQAALGVVHRTRLAQHEQVATRATIVKLFREILQAVPSCTFILDGLDECTCVDETRNGGVSVVHFLDKLRQAVTDTTAQILIVSRNEPEIRQRLMQYPGFNEYTISPGDFQWLRMQENFLRKGRNKKQLEKDIDETPPGLDHVYDRNWERIESLREAERTRAFSLLRWAAFSLRPLTVCEITEAVLINDDCDDLPIDDLPDAIDDDYIESEILGFCGSLIEVRGTTMESSPGLKMINLAHFSVKQYLLCKIPSQQAGLLVNESLRRSNEATENVILAKLCLRYISFQQVWDDLHAEGKRRIGTSFRDYAAGSWYQHATVKEAKDTALMEAMNALFDRSSQTWDAWRRWYDNNCEELQPHTTETSKPACPLYYATRLDLTTVVRHLTKHGKLDPNENSESGRTALGAACDKGNLEAVRLVMEAGANIDMVDHRRRTPIYAASHNGHVDVIKVLLEKGADISVADNDGWTPLNAASNGGHLEVVKVLLEKGADVSVASQSGLTPLNTASYGGHLEVVKVLLEKGADASVASQSGWTPLYIASSKGHLKVVKVLLEKGADVSVASQSGWTPLNAASYGGHLEVVKVLLEKGADISVANKDGWTPLNAASNGGHLEVVKVLLEKGADVSVADKDGLTPLNAASNGGHLEVVKVLLEKGADVSVADNDGLTPLNVASYGGHLEVVKVLLEKGADVSVADNDGWTPLNAASNGGHLEVVKVLLEKGADVSVADKDGWTPLYTASSKGHLEVVKVLLEKGADVSVANNNGWTPLNAASNGGHLEVVKVLTSRVDLDTKHPRYGRTALSYASEGGHEPVVQFLLANDHVTPCSMDHINRTPLFLASKGGHDAIFQALLNRESAAINWKDRYGSTPLSAAARHGHVNVVKSLLATEAVSINSRDQSGRTPLWWARRYGHSEVSQLLLESGKKRNISLDVDQTVPEARLSSLGASVRSGRRFETGKDSPGASGLLAEDASRTATSIPRRQRPQSSIEAFKGQEVRQHTLGDVATTSDARSSHGRHLRQDSSDDRRSSREGRRHELVGHRYAPAVPDDADVVDATPGGFGSCACPYWYDWPAAVELTHPGQCSGAGWWWFPKRAGGVAF
ncbi:ankyrin repeat domain-containing protein 52 [Colletotrichum sojae]|uniref:Ankyrin repeat domain-containing protein 52 n=1 Tax=Colletotrichum sojae TaxID=2175907 RepID=A0A8H6INR2_9PEZI|nr:ankyrin repeat domain-containing protein 52 [Colletotrichum sojae]